MNITINLDKQIEIMEKLTSKRMEAVGKNISIAEADFLAAMLPEVMLPYLDGDWFIGNYYELPIGHSSQVKGQGLGYYCLPRRFEKLLASDDVSDNQKERLIKIFQYWKINDTKSYIENRAGIKIKRALNLVNIDYTVDFDEIAMPLYRLAGTQLNYKLLLDLGITGLLEKIKEEVYDNDLNQAMSSVMLTLLQIIDNYILQIKNLIELKGSYDEKLEKILFSLLSLSKGKPNTLHESMQLIWLYAQCTGSYNYGRLDDYLAPYYSADIANNLLDDNMVCDYLASLYEAISRRASVTDGRFTIGGEGRKFPLEADKLSMLIMDVIKKRHSVLPQLTLRFSKMQNPMLMSKAYELIADGTTYPLLYNDDINIISVQEAFKVSYEEALQYLPYSCGEYVINHKSIGTPSGTLNVLKALEVTLLNGTELLSGRKIGLKLGGLKAFKTFDELMNAYKKQLSFYIDACTDFQMLEYLVAGDHNAFILVSVLMDNCIERSQSLLHNGVKYLCGALECYGNTNVADSLAAIKMLVYERNEISKTNLLKMLKADFVGYENERKMLENAPKYGNDDDYVDSIMTEIHTFICETIIQAGQRVGMHQFLAVLINNSFNSTFGLGTGASADGRHSHKYMANANNPSGGMDRNGETAMINSLLKLDSNIHAGYVQNMKFSKSMFSDHFVQLKFLLDSYFRQGGTQSMISVLNKGDLEDALLNPYKYTNLLVRVGGFSAKFIELPRYVQDEIISRTQY